jgi:hypothetical protein
MGSRNPQFIEEQLAHILIVMLTGMNKQRVKKPVFSERPHQRSYLDKIRPCTAHTDDFDHIQQLSQAGIKEKPIFVEMLSC